MCRVALKGRNDAGAASDVVGYRNRLFVACGGGLRAVFGPLLGDCRDGRGRGR